MPTDADHAIDWKDAAAYAPLLAADRSILAWEWLRRDPAYRIAARRAFDGRGGPGEVASKHWGLHLFEEPSRAAPLARPVWRADIDSAVLEADVIQVTGNADAFDLRRFRAIATIVKDGAARCHLLLSDGLRTIRLDVLGKLKDEPVTLSYRLAGFASVESPLLTLRRFVFLQEHERFSSALHSPQERASRLILMLRAHDALAMSATQREIAAALLSGDAAQARWRIGTPTLRSRAQRLVRAARIMSGGGYRSLLRR